MNKAPFAVRFGKSLAEFWTIYHAEQFKRALDLNGTPCELIVR